MLCTDNTVVHPTMRMSDNSMYGKNSVVDANHVEPNLNSVPVDSKNLNNINLNLGKPFLNIELEGKNFREKVGSEKWALYVVGKTHGILVIPAKNITNAQI